MAVGDENVTIRINVKADTSAIDRVRRKLAQLCAEADSCEETFRRHSEAIDKDVDSQKKLHTENDKTTQQLRRMGRESNALAKILKTSYKFAFIGAGIETVGLALALSSVNGLLATGRFLVKAYQVVMSGLAKAAAAAGVALATVAAAQRQYMAAQATGRYGGSFAKASAGLRAMTGDARLASLGMKSLQGAFTAASRNAPVTGATASALAGLADFAVVSGDIEKGTAALATFVSLVQKGGPGGKGVAEAAAEIGPEFDKAFKEISRGGKATTAELMKAFSSGELAQKAGIAGGMGAVSGSLMGQFKAFVTKAQVMFGDLGFQFIGPIQQAFDQLSVILQQFIIRISPILQDFARGDLLDKVVSGVDKISEFTVGLMRDYVPKTQNFFQTMSKAWDRITSGFERFGAYLRQFSEASKIMNHFLGQIFGAIGSGLKNNFESFAKLIVDNRSDFDKFGKSLANLITQIFNLFSAIREAFMQALPAITAVVNTVARLVQTIADLLRMITPLGGGTGLGGLAALMLPMAAGLAFRGRGGGGAGGAFGTFLPGRTMGGKAGMTGGKALGIGAGVLGVAGASQIPGVGDAVAPIVSAGLMGAMFAPAGAVKGTGAMGKLFAGGLGKSYAMKAGLAGAGVVASNVAADYGYRHFGTAGALAGGVSTGMAFGAAVGGPAGAVVGGLIGGVIAFTKSGKYKKQARKAAQGFVDEYSTGIEEAFKANDYKTATDALKNFDTAALEMARGQVDSGTALDKANELWTQTGRQYQNQAERLTGRLSDLVQITGKTKDQIVEVANAAGVDLSSGLLTLQDIMIQTGEVTERLGQDFENYLVDTFSQDIGVFRQTADKLQAPRVMDEITWAFIDSIRAIGGKAGTTEAAQFLEQIMTQQNLVLGPAGADIALLEMLGGRGAAYGETAFGTGAAFLPGGALGIEGISPEAAQALGPLLSAYYGQRATSYAGATAQNLITALAGQGYMPGISADELSKKLAGLPLDKLIALSSKVAQGDLFRQEGKVTPYGFMPGVPIDRQLQQIFEAAGLKGTNIELQKTSAQISYDASMIFAGAVDKAVGNGVTSPGFYSTPQNVGTVPTDYTVTPWTSRVDTARNTTYNNDIKISVTTAPGTDVEAVANAVMRKFSNEFERK